MSQESQCLEQTESNREQSQAKARMLRARMSAGSQDHKHKSGCSMYETAGSPDTQVGGVCVQEEGMEAPKGICTRVPQMCCSFQDH